jgi:hypothetical protein
MSHLRRKGEDAASMTIDNNYVSSGSRHGENEGEESSSLEPTESSRGDGGKNTTRQRGPTMIST